MVRLARELELYDILPTAYYELQKWYPCNAAYEDRCQYVSVRTNVLDKDDLRVLLLGKEWLRDAVEMSYKALIGIAREMRFCACSTLEQKKQCKDAATQWLENQRDTHRRQYDFPECRDPIWNFKKMEDQLRGKDEMASPRRE